MQCDQSVSPYLCMFDFPAVQDYTLVKNLYPDPSGTRSIMITPSFQVPKDGVMSVYLNQSIGINFPLSVDLLWSCDKLAKPSINVSLALRNMATGEIVSSFFNTVPFDGRVGNTCDPVDGALFPFPLTTMLPRDWLAHVTAGPYAWFLLLQTSQALLSSFYYAVNHIRIGDDAAKSPCRFLFVYDTSATTSKKALKLQKKANKHKERARYHLLKAKQLSAPGVV
jgi:hypothetical protein